MQRSGERGRLSRSLPTVLPPRAEPQHGAAGFRDRAIILAYVAPRSVPVLLEGVEGSKSLISRGDRATSSLFQVSQETRNNAGLLSILQPAAGHL